MRLLVRADASSHMGTGHVMRCLALAQAWQAEGGAVDFLMATSAPGLEARLQQEGFEVFYQEAALGSQNDAENTIALAQQLQVDRLVVDGYHFGAEYQQQLKSTGLPVLFIDDNAHAEYYCSDWVLNQNIYAHEEMYEHREPNTKLLLGTRYALLRKEFWPWRGWQRKIAPLARKVLVTLGGADPENITLQVIQALQQNLIPDLEVIVVVGGSNPHYEVLQTVVQDSVVKIELQRNVTNMPELMAWADVAISGGGSTCWELAFMGLPSLIITLAENQVPTVKKLHSMGIFWHLGFHKNLDNETIENHLARLLKSGTLQEHKVLSETKIVDGQGVSRVISLLKN